MHIGFVHFHKGPPIDLQVPLSVYVGKLPNLAATRIITFGRIIADEGKSPHLNKIQGGEILLFGLDTIFVGDPRKLKPSPATVLLCVDCQPFFRHDTFTLRDSESDMPPTDLSLPLFYIHALSGMSTSEKNRTGPNWWSFQTENFPKESCMCLN